ncbi:MAG: hypothetical protein ACJAQ9_000805, partial [Ilumatobacter sp.]
TDSFAHADDLDLSTVGGRDRLWQVDGSKVIVWLAVQRVQQ